MMVNVVVINVVTLNPLDADKVNNLFTEILYTYHRTSVKNGITWIFIEETQDWYPLEWFRTRELCYN